MSLALEARDITKLYGHVSALSGANFGVKAGEVVALIGDNGAGKSTLVKILSGTESPTSGEILVDGKQVTIDGPLAARHYGIETVYQDLALAPHLNPVQNMYLGREIMRPGVMNQGWASWTTRTCASEARGVRPARRHGVEQLFRRHRRHVGRPEAGGRGRPRRRLRLSRSCFLDETTAALGVVQTRGVLDLHPPPGPRPRARRGVHQPLDAPRDRGRRRGSGAAAVPAGG